MDTEATLNAGDVCLDCQQKGLEKYLRYFKINLHGDTILKCESNQCMYPYNDEISSSDDEDKCLDNVPQTNSLKLINDLIQQFDYEEGVEDTLGQIALTASSSEQVAQFDITFLDDFKAEDNENLCKTEIIDDKTLQYFPLLETKSPKYDVVASQPSSYDFQTQTSKFADETFKNSFVAPSIPSQENITDLKKTKIKIQSVETLSIESPLYHNLPSTSKKCMITEENTTPHLYTPLAADKTGEINKKKLKSQTITLNSQKNASTETPLSATTEEAQTFSIPKAEILKANAVLKRLASIEANDQFPAYNKKYKKARTKDCKKNNTAKPIIPEPSSSLKSDSNYSFDKITQMLFARK